MGRVYRRGDTWWIQYSHDGKRRRESSHSTRRPDAVALLKRRQDEAGKGRPHEDATKVLLSDLKALIDADYRMNGRRSAKRVGQSWEHVAAFFGDRESAVNVTAPRLALYLTSRTDQGAARATVKNELAALKRAFNLARKSGTLLPNEIPAFPTISSSTPRPGFFERDEHEAVRAALPADAGDVAEFMYWTGWRKSEVLSLRWANVDESAGVIRIETTKNREPRTLPYGVLPALAELIEHRRAVTEDVQRQRGIIVTHVFHRNGEPIRYFRRSWLSACIAAGLGREVTDRTDKVVERIAYRIPHDYRRSAARNLSRAGVPERVIMQLCGWKTRSVFDRYRIVAERDLAEGLAKLAEAPASTAKARKVGRIERKP
jgi:integrase